MTTPVHVRRDWYQTDSTVVVTLLHKGHQSKEVTVKFAPTSLDVFAQFEGCDDYTLHLNLLTGIVQDKCTWKCFATKIEIRLRKADAMRWHELERSSTPAKDTVESAAFGEQSQPSASTYPSSSQKKRDWDKLVVDIVKEEEEEEKNDQGESAVNRLFQKIYSDGSEEQQRAMNKSFAESGGTVLSTNWKEVKEKQVEVKPPDGMEFIKWDQ